MKDCFGMSVNLDYFLWKFSKNPAGFVEGFYAVSEQGEIAAYYGAIPEQYSINGCQTIIYQSCDTMTHSKHRRKGLFQKLATHCYNYLKENDKLFVIGFGGTQSAPGLVKFGWTHLFDIKYYFRTKYQVSFRNLFQKNSNVIKDQIYVRKIENLIDIVRLNDILEKPSIYKIIDKTVLEWKLSNPLYDFIIEGIYDINNNLLAYIIYFIQNNKVFIYDFGYDGSCDNSIRRSIFAIIDKVVLTQKLKGCITFSQSKIVFSDELQKNGYISNNFKLGPLCEKIPFMIYSNLEKNDLIKCPKSWAITPIYHDSL